MDWRVKSFEGEARSAFACLVEKGFVVGSEPIDVRKRPAWVTVRFHGTEQMVETSLVLGFAGEDAVHTTTGSSEFGPTVAHTGREMKKALAAHAQSVRSALASP
jgi:hypothetical protein